MVMTREITVTMMEPSVERPVTEVLAGKGQFQASKSQMQERYLVAFT